MTGFRQVNEFFSTGQIYLQTDINEFNLTPNQPLVLSAFPIISSLDVALQLTGNAVGLPLPNPADTTETKNDFGAGGSETLTFSNPQVGTAPYIAQVSNVSGTTGSFLLEVSSEDGNNNDPSTAPQIGNLASSVSFNGFVGRSDSTDWYNFRLAADGKVNLGLSGLEDNADLELYESNGTTLILRSENGGTDNESLTNVDLEAGNYLVKISSNAVSANLADGEGASTNYTLNLSEATDTDTDEVTGIPIYRFYNTNTGTHFYTASEIEKNYVRDNLTGFNYEGPSFAANDGSDPDADPVYRFYNTFTGTHFYTISDFEANFVRNNLAGFRDEGVAYYAYDQAQQDTIDLYRFYNTVTGTHFYTPSTEERNVVDQLLPSYNYEGVGYYVQDINELTLV